MLQISVKYYLEKKPPHELVKLGATWIYISYEQVSEFLATDPEARVRFPALPEKKGSVSGTGSTQPREYN
jgi:hypothetical protein